MSGFIALSPLQALLLILLLILVLVFLLPHGLMHFCMFGLGFITPSTPQPDQGHIRNFHGCLAKYPFTSHYASQRFNNTASCTFRLAAGIAVA
jgi:hypothetical protein